MTVAECLFKNRLLLPEQADEVYNDLNHLHIQGEWDQPEWAQELGSRYNVGPADPCVISVAWRAVAKAYKKECENGVRRISK